MNNGNTTTLEGLKQQLGEASQKHQLTTNQLADTKLEISKCENLLESLQQQESYYKGVVDTIKAIITVMEKEKSPIENLREQTVKELSKPRLKKG